MTDNKSTKVLIGEVRFSYVHLFQPRQSSPTDKAKYSVSLIIPKSDKALIDKIKAGIAAAYNGGVQRFGGTLPPKGTWRNPLRDGDLEKSEDEAYKGSYFINAQSQTKPGLVKPDPSGMSKFIPITDEEELYSGCYGYAAVNFFAYNNAGNKGISAGLNNVLKTRNGDFLGGRVSADAEFDDLDLSAIGQMPDSPAGDDDIF